MKRGNSQGPNYVADYVVPLPSGNVASFSFRDPPTEADLAALRAIVGFTEEQFAALRAPAVQP
jgi:hypothetical protein